MRTIDQFRQNVWIRQRRQVARISRNRHTSRYAPIDLDGQSALNALIGRKVLGQTGPGLYRQIEERRVETADTVIDYCDSLARLEAEMGVNIA